jgi:hypothetical protein
VERVIDGDTLVMENGERVHLIRVDTSETKHPAKPVEHFGKEAAAFTRRMAEGKHVRLKFDPAKMQHGLKTARNRDTRWLLRVPRRRHVAQCGDYQAGLRLRLHALSVCSDGGV